MLKARPWVIGHRGAMGHAPENTLASFETGWRMGADAVECDVHFCRDRRLVVIHDETLERTTDGTGRVADRPWSYLKKLDAGAWYGERFRGERLRTLEELARWVHGKRTKAGEPLNLVVEVKQGKVPAPGMAEEVVKILRRAGLLFMAFVISFHHPTVRRVKRLCPEIRTSLLYSRSVPGLARRARWSRADALFLRWNLATPGLLKRAAALRLFTAVWTVNEFPLMKKMVRLGVGAVTSNFPDRMARLVK